MRPIKEGDTVTVCMARGQMFDFQIGMWIYRATVLHVPEAPGALWCFRAGGKDGIEFAVNPCASDFVGLIFEDMAIDGTLRPHHLYAQPNAQPIPMRWMDWPGRPAMRNRGRW